MREERIVLMIFWVLFLLSFISAQLPQEVCEPNHQWCDSDSNKILKCSEDGGQYSTIQECGLEQICLSKQGEPQCINAEEKTSIKTISIILNIIFLIIILFLLIKKKKKV